MALRRQPVQHGVQMLRDRRASTPKKTVGGVVAEYLPNRLAADLANQAGQYNIENRLRGKQLEYGSYQDAINSLAKASSGSLNTPESEAAAKAYAEQEALKNQRLGTWLGFGGTLAKK